MKNANNQTIFNGLDITLIYRILLKSLTIKIRFFSNGVLGFWGFGVLGTLFTALGLFEFSNYVIRGYLCLFSRF